MGAVEDQAVVEKVLAGETSAFEVILRRWQGPLVNLAYRFCRDRGRAEEMAQQAFLRVYRSLGQWRREAAFSAFALILQSWKTVGASWIVLALVLSFASVKLSGRLVSGKP